MACRPVIDKTYYYLCITARANCQADQIQALAKLY